MTFHKVLLALPLLALGCPADDDDANEDGADTGGSTGTEEGGTNTPTDSGESCTPGQVEACLCPDMSGSTQICLSDGSGFSACDCVGGDDDEGSADSASSAESSGGGETSASGSSDEGVGDSGTEAGASEGPMPECDGSSHPLVDGDLRYCEPGNCYCGDFSVDPPYDTCYMEAIAEPCCPVEVVCY